MIPHIMKITDVASNTIIYPMASECSKCHKPLVIPEPYVSWYRRVLDNDITTLKLTCPQCGGVERDPYMHYSKSWESGPAGEQRESIIVPQVTSPPRVIDPTGSFDRSDSFYGDDMCSGMGFHPYTYAGSLWQALNDLKAFIPKPDNNQIVVKEVDRGQHGIVE